MVSSCVCLSGAEETVTSLVDVISPKEHARFIKALEAAQPYDDARTAYLIVQALSSLGFTDADKNVSVQLGCKPSILLPVPLRFM